MSLGGFLMGLLDVVLYCAIVIFIAYCILWALSFFGIALEGNVYKWGRIIVGLICLIAIVGFLLSVLGMGGSGYTPHFFHR